MIIVVIITLIILFVISVVYFKPVDDPLNSFIQKDLSTGIISAMLKTDSGCTKDTTLEDLFIDITKTPLGTIQCTSELTNVLSARYPDNEFCQDIIMSRGALECGVSQILYTLQIDINRPYHFKVKSNDNKFLETDGLIPFPPSKYLEEEFSRATSVDVTPYSLPLYPSIDVLEIWLCIGGECPNI